MAEPVVAQMTEEYLTGLFGTQVSVYLVNGIKLQGRVTGHDALSIKLSDKASRAESNEAGPEQLVFRHAVSTILPSHK